MKDVIVIGGGPAGMTAAIYLKRFKRDIAVLMKDYGTLAKTDLVENYYGFVQPLTGKELVENGVTQARQLGIDIFDEEALSIVPEDGYFIVKTSKTIYQTKTVLLATGASRVNLAVKGFSQLTGKGISFCAVCDGFLYRGKKIGVIGAGDYMLEELDVLRQFSSDITVFTNAEPLNHEVKEPIVTEVIEAFVGDDRLTAIKTKTATHLLDGVFVAIGTPSAADFALKIGAVIEKNAIVVDEQQMTNVPGLFAAGDCTGGLLQIAKAVDDGAKAALSINKYLKKLTVKV